jgi:hypothetical protein
MFEFDKGAEGSSGPWLVWAARGTQDGQVPAKTFYVREENSKTPLPSIAEGGVILDIHSLKTGWQHGEGVKGQAPKWQFGASPARLPEKPGDEWKKGFSMKVAIGGGQVVDWEQSGAAVWNCLTSLIPAINAGPASDPNKLPLVRMTGAIFEEFSRGSTNTPVLEIVQWVDRPECLKSGVAAGIDAGKPEAPATAAPAPAQTPPPAAQGFQPGADMSGF